MRQFLIRLTLFLAIQLVIGGTLLCFYRVDESRYLAATHDKHKLLEAQESPRMIFIGGSSMAFGIDSEYVERHLSYKPVNMALHVSLTLEFMLREVQGDLRAGDVVVIAPEYNLLTSETTRQTGNILTQMLEQRPESAAHLTMAHVRAIADDGAFAYGASACRRVCRAAIGKSRKPRPPYLREGFNEWGDMTAHWGMEDKAPAAITRQRLFPADFSPDYLAEAIDLLNRFEAECRRKRVRVFFTYPSLCRKHFEDNRRHILEIADELDGRLQFPVVDRPDTSAFPLDHYYDTYYHLNKRGVSKRTATLVKNLAVYLSSPVNGQHRDARPDSGRLYRVTLEERGIDREAGCPEHVPRGVRTLRKGLDLYSMSPAAK